MRLLLVLLLATAAWAQPARDVRHWLETGRSDLAWPAVNALPVSRDSLVSRALFLYGRAPYAELEKLLRAAFQLCETPVQKVEVLCVWARLSETNAQRAERVEQAAGVAASVVLPPETAARLAVAQGELFEQIGRGRQAAASYSVARTLFHSRGNRREELQQLVRLARLARDGAQPEARRLLNDARLLALELHDAEALLAVSNDMPAWLSSADRVRVLLRLARERRAQRAVALDLRRRAQALAGGFVPGEVASLVVVGETLTPQQRRAELQRALALWKRLPPPAWNDELLAGRDPSGLERRIGQSYAPGEYSSARPHFEKAVALAPWGKAQVEALEAWFRTAVRAGVLEDARTAAARMLALAEAPATAGWPRPGALSPGERAEVANSLTDLLLPRDALQRELTDNRPESEELSPARVVLAPLLAEPRLANSLARAYEEDAQHWLRQGQLERAFSVLLQESRFLSLVGRGPEALNAAEKALTLGRQLGHSGRAYEQLARLHLAAGHPEEAATALSSVEGEGRALCLGRLALLRLEQGQSSEGVLAEAFALKSRYGPLLLCVQARQEPPALAAATLAKVVAEIEPRWKVGPLLNLARAQRRLKQTAAAEVSYRQALALLGEVRRQPLALRDLALELGLFLEEGQPQAALEVYRKGIDSLLEVRALYPPTEAAALSEQQVSRQLFERAISLSLAGGEQAEALELLSQSRLLELSALFPESPQTQEIRLKLSAQASDPPVAAPELSRAAFLASLNTIRSQNPDFEQHVPTRTGELLALQPRLAPDTVVVEFYPAEDALYALAVSRDQLMLKEVRVDRRRLRELVTTWRSQLAGRLDDADTARLLGTLLLEPLAPLLRGHKRVEVLPSGLLWYIPFEALRWPETAPWIEGWQVSYRLALDSAPRATVSASPRLVAVGAPVATDLPSADRELTAVAGLFPGSVRLAGSLATPAALASAAAGADILHLATHSAPAPADPNASFLELSGGRLSLAQVYGLRLPPSSLVVLSSCESAVGEVNPGREVASLASAFTAAGASSVVASLWRVQDDSTLQLMEAFYKALGTGASRAAALRTAKLELAHNAATSSPYFWAPFVLYGEP